MNKMFLYYSCGKCLIFSYLIQANKPYIIFAILVYILSEAVFNKDFHAREEVKPAIVNLSSSAGEIGRN